jgi:hypothetical protein
MSSFTKRRGSVRRNPMNWVTKGLVGLTCSVAAAGCQNVYSPAKANQSYSNQGVCGHYEAGRNALDNVMTALVAAANATNLTGCTSMQPIEIEAYTYRGYCQDAAGQGLTPKQCRQKLKRELPVQKSVGEMMAANLDKALQERKMTVP